MALVDDVANLVKKMEPYEGKNGTLGVFVVSQRYGDGATRTLLTTNNYNLPTGWTGQQMTDILGGRDYLSSDGHAEGGLERWLSENPSWYIVNGATQRNLCQARESNVQTSCFDLLSEVPGLKLGPPVFRKGRIYKSKIRTVYTP
jgi:hypothetical protein